MRGYPRAYGNGDALAMRSGAFSRENSTTTESVVESAYSKCVIKFHIIDDQWEMDVNIDETTEGEKSDSQGSDNATEPGPDGHQPNRIWWRLLYMLILVLLYSLSRLVVCAVMVFQFFWSLINGEPNHRLKELAQSLATYTYQIVSYLTFASEELPFPLDGEWPRGAPH